MYWPYNLNQKFSSHLKVLEIDDESYSWSRVDACTSLNYSNKLEYDEKWKNFSQSTLDCGLAELNSDVTSVARDLNRQFKNFSSLDNEFGELEDFDGMDQEEERAPWKITQDESFTLLTGKYENMNPECLEDEDEETDKFLDQYLLTMSPIVDNKTKDRDEKGKKGTTSRTLPRRPHDVSVKCSDSTEEIVGTPSEVALRLNEAIEHYLPRRKIRIEKEVGKEAAVALDEQFDKDTEEDSEPLENSCAEEEPPYIPETRRGCPGSYDRLLKNNVSCADALTLREIALGRRMERPDFVLPTDDDYETIQTAQYTQPTQRDNRRDNYEKEGCCCSKKKKKPKTQSPPPMKSCCTKQQKPNKSVSFSF